MDGYCNGISELRLFHQNHNYIINIPEHSIISDIFRHQLKKNE